MDDEKGHLARTSLGQLYRLRLSVILSYTMSVAAKKGVFKNIQVDLKFPKGTLASKKTIKIDSLVLTGSSTPFREEVDIFAQRDLVPHDLDVEASLTYQ